VKFLIRIQWVDAEFVSKFPSKGCKRPKIYKFFEFLFSFIWNADNPTFFFMIDLALCATMFHPFEKIDGLSLKILQKNLIKQKIILFLKKYCDFVAFIPTFYQNELSRQNEKEF